MSTVWFFTSYYDTFLFIHVLSFKFNTKKIKCAKMWRKSSFLYRL